MDDLNPKGCGLNNYMDIFLDDNDNEFYNTNVSCQENCVNCYYSSLGFCTVQNKYVNKHTPTCWSYRDCFTMRTSDYYQDDEDYYE